MQPDNLNDLQNLKKIDCCLDVIRFGYPDISENVCRTSIELINDASAKNAKLAELGCALDEGRQAQLSQYITLAEQLGTKKGREYYAEKARKLVEKHPGLGEYLRQGQKPQQ